MDKEQVESRKIMKAAEKKKRKVAIEKAPAPAPKPVEVDKTISFDQWWMLLNKKISLPYYKKEIIAADFKARGLSQSEKAETFDAALRSFGIKF